MDASYHTPRSRTKTDVPERPRPGEWEPYRDLIMSIFERAHDDAYSSNDALREDALAFLDPHGESRGYLTLLRDLDPHLAGVAATVLAKARG